MYTTILFRLIAVLSGWTKGPATFRNTWSVLGSTSSTRTGGSPPAKRTAAFVVFAGSLRVPAG
jgi:hypothetical protein